jgi:hypothetical protein
VPESFPFRWHPIVGVGSSTASSDLAPFRCQEIDLRLHGGHSPKLNIERSADLGDRGFEGRESVSVRHTASQMAVAGRRVIAKRRS